MWKLALIISLAFVLRLLLLLGITEDYYFGDYIFWDEQPYHIIVNKILTSSYHPNNVFPVSPVIIYLMVALYKIFSPDIIYMRYASLLFGTGLCLVVYAITHKVFNQRTALLACLLTALYQPLVLYSAVPLKTSFNVFFFSYFVLYLIYAFDKKYYLIFAGLSLALLIPGRQQALIYIYTMPVLLFFFYSEKKLFSITYFKNLSLFYLGVAVVFLPIAVRNYLVADSFRVTPNTSGFSLYSVYDPDNPEPYFKMAPFATGSVAALQYKTTVEARRRMAKPISQAEASDYWMKVSIQRLLNASLDKLITKALAVLNYFEVGDNYEIYFWRDYFPVLKFAFLTALLLIPFGFTGLICNFKKSPKTSLLSVLLLLYASTLFIAVTQCRFRLPMIILLIPFAAAFILNQKTCKTIFTCLVFLFLSLLPIPGTDDAVTGYNTYSLRLFKKGKTKEAMTLLEGKKDALDLYADYSLSNLAYFAASNKNFNLEKYYLECIPHNSIISASKYARLGKLALQSGDMTQAVKFFRRSLEIDSSEVNLNYQMFKLLQNSSPREAKFYYKQYVDNNRLLQKVMKN